MCLKFKEEIPNSPTIVKFLIDDNVEVTFEFTLLKVSTL
jgi:hypothetical protein